ncbi:MAG: hypothetical protein QOK43_462 [Acidimicrobiaceae bacterium]|nr:hypothetical protein [Acidimicrobiaceae bacterium]MDQ1446139.1 hypothetical protein [Acidimicrobiaceae bacterium]
MNVLKRSSGYVDPLYVKTCEGCGLPAPLSTDTCAMCAKPFRRATPTAYRVTAAGHGYRWTIDGEQVAFATWRDETWDIADTAADRVDVTVIPVRADGIDRFAIVDHRGRMAATFNAGDGIVRDSHGQPLLLVRGDGPTGVHIVDREGVVVSLASPVPNQEGLDVLVTPVGNGENRRLLLGVSLAIVLAGVAAPTPRRS